MRNKHHWRGANVDIGIIGSGKIGGTAAKLFSRAGHRVVLANSRGPESLAAEVASLGPGVRAGTVDDAAKFGQLVLVAIPLGKYQTLPASALSGKIVIDAMNYYPQRDGELPLGGRTSSELVAGHLPSARVVKAFNTMFFETLGSRGRTDVADDDRLALFVAGDDADAKAVVARLIEEIGFAPVDTGPLRDSGRQQPGSPIYNKPMTGREAGAALRALH
jgi:predicted dinucleotide-binding enzyme